MKDSNANKTLTSAIVNYEFRRKKTKKLPANTPGLQLYSSLKIHCSVLHMDVCATAAVTPIIMK